MKQLVIQFQQQLKLHKKIIQLRNKHIAHSELKQERSIIGFQLVRDPAYGIRPSTVFSNVTARRWFPKDKDLKKLSAHCALVDEQVVRPLMLKKAKALREQLLKMSEEDIESMRDFKDAPTTFDQMFS